MDRIEIIPKEKIDRAILFIRGEKVMLDIDLAEVYGVKTKRLNEQVKRNIARFPADFMFQLTNEEKEMWSQFATTLKRSNTRQPIHLPLQNMAQSCWPAY